MKRLASLTAPTSLITAALLSTAASAADFPVPLRYNFNGMVHLGEEFSPDEPSGYRSISDRGLALNGNVGSIDALPLTGSGGIPYVLNTSSFALDIVHLGDRNTVDGGNWAFDPNVNGDDVGIQPDWLIDTNQTGPQTTDVTDMNLTLDASAEIGILYQISNGGGRFNVTLAFTDNSSVTVQLHGPDWFQTQNPIGPLPGCFIQRRLGTYNGTANVDAADPGATLNVAEAVLSVADMLLDGFGNHAGKQLASITFSDRTNLSAGYAIIAATVRTALGPPDNDQCEDCTPISEGTYAGSSTRATGTDISSCADGDAGDVWYCYTASVTGHAQASTCGAPFNTTLAVYSDCGGSELACDDDGCGLNSLVEWEAVANTTYLIRVSGAGGGSGDFMLTVANPTVFLPSVPLRLNYNFNGMVHTGEDSQPDNPDGYRSISDRGMIVDGNITSFGSGTVRGGIGHTYKVVQEAGVLDIVHVGDRNTVDGGNHFFDPAPNGDAWGIQPNWLPSTDQTGPQASDVSERPLVMTGETQIGVLMNVSNGGGALTCTLGFSDTTSVAVTLEAPDWFGSQTPGAPYPGGILVSQLGVYTGAGNVDFGTISLPLNVVETIVSAQEIFNDGLGDITGKTLESITFSDRQNLNAGYAIYAVSVRGADEPVLCEGDVDGDGDVDLTDLAYLLTNFGTPSGMTREQGDLDGDGDVDLTDLAYLLTNFGTVC